MQHYKVHAMIASSAYTVSLHQQAENKSLKCKAHANPLEQISRYSPQWAGDRVDIIHE